MRPAPHVIGVDDGPFTKGQAAPVPLVAVRTQGATLVEGVACTHVPVDPADATDRLAGWLGGLRALPGARALMLGGITVAGLGLIDLRALADALGIPVLAVTRRAPSDARLRRALAAAGFEDRAALVDRSPPAHRVEAGLYVASARIEAVDAGALLRTSRAKSKLPEALRLAHLIAAALVRGESRGRV